MRGLILLTVAIAFSASNVFAGYYDESGKGWWWYDRTKPEEEQSVPAPQAQQSKVAQSPKPENEKRTFDRNVSLSEFTYDEVWNMHPDDFYELQEALKKKAVQYPTEANTRDYYEAQEIARKKAMAFTSSAQYVWQKYPELSGVAAAYPSSVPGDLARVGMIKEEKKKTLQSVQDRFALIYFMKDDCQYCGEQSKINEWFKSNTGWQVKPVNINQNPAMGAKFGIQMVPSLILIQKGNQDYFPVSQGVVDASELEDKTYRAVKALTGTSPENINIYDFQRGGGLDVNTRPSWRK